MKICKFTYNIAMVTSSWHFDIDIERVRYIEPQRWVRVCPILRFALLAASAAPPPPPPHFSPSCLPTIRHCTMAPIQRCLPPRATIAPAQDQHWHINKGHGGIFRAWQGLRPAVYGLLLAPDLVTWPATGRQPLNIALLSFPFSSSLVAPHL